MKFLFVFILMPLFLEAQDLQKHQWENRIIVVSSPEFGNSDAKNQLALLKVTTKALTDRNVVVYHVTNSGFTLGFDNEILVFKNSESSITSFNVSLIGLDGNEKFHASNVQKAEKFLSLIDAMPMRRNEVEIKNRK